MDTIVGGDLWQLLMLEKGANLGVQNERGESTSRNERDIEPSRKIDLRGKQLLGD